MKEEDCRVSETNKRNLDQPLPGYNQTTPVESPIFAYLRNEGLFSKEMDSQQTGETSSLQVHYNNPDDILNQIGFVPSVIEIPDEVYRKIIEVAAIAACPDMAGKWKLPHSLCEYCNHSIECKLCGVDILTRVRK